MTFWPFTDRCCSLLIYAKSHWLIILVRSLMNRSKPHSVCVCKYVTGNLQAWPWLSRQQEMEIEGWERRRCGGMDSGSVDSRLWLAAVSVFLCCNESPPCQCRRNTHSCQSKLSYMCCPLSNPHVTSGRGNLGAIKPACSPSLCQAYCCWKKATFHLLFKVIVSSFIVILSFFVLFYTMLFIVIIIIISYYLLLFAGLLHHQMRAMSNSHSEHDDSWEGI